jgi:hypothetical protein
MELAAAFGDDRTSICEAALATKQHAALAYDRQVRQRGEDKALNYESIAAAEEAAAQAQADLPPPPRPAPGFYGVSANGKRWGAKINYDSKAHYLGSFDTKQEAALAYDREARQCGEDKALNYPESIAEAEEAAAATAAKVLGEAAAATAVWAPRRQRSHCV